MFIDTPISKKYCLVNLTANFYRLQRFVIHNEITTEATIIRCLRSYFHLISYEKLFVLFLRYICCKRCQIIGIYEQKLQPSFNLRNNRHHQDHILTVSV